MKQRRPTLHLQSRCAHRRSWNLSDPMTTINECIWLILVETERTPGNQRKFFPDPENLSDSLPSNCSKILEWHGVTGCFIQPCTDSDSMHSRQHYISRQPVNHWHVLHDLVNKYMSVSRPSLSDCVRHTLVIFQIVDNFSTLTHSSFLKCNSRFPPKIRDVALSKVHR